MADIRINALATTAASTASDDFIAIDGSANGTRKLDAFSPTFGGNLTVSGTASVSGQINGSAGYQFRGATGTAYELLRYAGGTNNPGVFATVNESTKKVTIIASGSVVGGQTLGFGAEGSESLTLGAANATLAGNLTVSGGTISGANTAYIALTNNNTYSAGAAGGGHTFVGTGNSSFGGNLLIGTTTDSANGKLQLATHSSYTGGIGFGTDTSLFRAASGNLGLYGTGTSSKITFSHSTTTAGKGFDVECDSAKDAYVWNRENRNIYFGTNNTTALTLDSSQNATFEKNINAGGASNDADIRLHLTAAGDTSAKFAALWRNSSSTKIFHLRADGDLYTSAGATITGAIAIGNTVQTAAAVASTHKVTISIGGTTYYLLATNV